MSKYIKLKTFLFACACCVAVSSSAQTYEKIGNGVKAVSGTTDICVEFYTPSTVRVLKSVKGETFTKESLAVIAKPQEVKLSTTCQDNKLTLKSTTLRVVLDLQTGQLVFYDESGTSTLLEEKDAPRFTPTDDAGTRTYRVRQAFSLEADETIYGLGNLENGQLSQRGVVRTLMPGNVEDGIPFFQSVKGYGLYWDNYSPTEFADCDGETALESEVGDCIDYYFLYGGNADGVVAEMRRLTGEVPMFPLWTYGFWQSRERYKSQEELLGVLRKYRELNIPIDGLIQDWQYWGNNYLWNAMEFMNADFSRPQEMMDEIHSRNAHLIISIWSSFGPQTKPYRELAEQNLLFNFSTWPQSGISEQWPPRMDYPSGVRVYDAYSPVARDIYWRHLRRLYDFGMDGWWMDSTEPDHLDFKPEDMDTPTALGSFRRMRGAYPLLAVGGVHDHQRATSSDKRVFILTRSGFAGQQRYGCNVWSGDVVSTWEALRKQIPAGLNFSLTGNPNFNSDLGGFFAGAYNEGYADGSGARNPAYRELYVRWMQFGVCCPMMRSHGTDVPRELYYYGQPGEPVYDALVSAVRLRYALLPYIYSTSWEVTHRQSTFMRALMMDFADDRRTWNIGDQYMFGSSLLVAPVLHAQYTPELVKQVSADDGWNQEESGDKRAQQSGIVDFTRSSSTTLYLPAGTEWYDFWTNERLEGGQEVTRETTLATLPLYVRAGGIIPLGPDVQYATEKPWDNLEVRIYPGADGRFVLYEDEGDNYNYEQGAYTEIPFTWDDASHRLTIGARMGHFTGMMNTRRFTLVLPDGTRREVSYSGKKMIVKF